jgi:hypothetical protein
MLDFNDPTPLSCGQGGGHPTNTDFVIKPIFDLSDLDSKTISSHVDELKEQLVEEVDSALQFPVEVFPDEIQHIIKETNEHLNYPIDFIGSSLLYAASVAIGNTHVVELKKGFIQNAVIYLAIVGRPGTNKSHPLTFALQPIVERDKESYAKFKTEMKEYKATEKIDKEGVSKAKPHWLKHLVSDYTPEALVSVHEINRRGIGIYVDELAGWFKNFNRYNKGSEQEFWLSAWSGKAITIDRKSSDPILISDPFISVAGTIQNGMLKELAGKNRSENGFIDRMLFAFPEKLKKNYWSDKEVTLTSFDSWNEILSIILDIELIFEETIFKPEILKFSEEALEILLSWQKSNTDKSNEVESEEIAGIYSKLEIYVLRFSLILELLQFACKEGDKSTISKESVLGAIKLAEYFENTAISVKSHVLAITPVDKLSLLQAKVYKALPELFRTGMGVEISIGLGLPKRTFQRFIKDKSLFKYLDRGVYEKLY